MLLTGFLLFLSLGQFVIGVAVLLESLRTKRPDQKLFAAISFVLTVWTLAVGFLSDFDRSATIENLSKYQLANQLAFFTTVLVLILVLLLMQYYPKKSRIDSTIIGLTASGVVLSLISPLPFFAGHFEVLNSEVSYIYGKGMVLICLFALVVLLNIFFHNRNVLKKTKLVEENLKLDRQTKILRLGVFLTILHTLVFVVVLPGTVGQWSLLYAIGYAGPYYLLILTAYGMFQFGLFDIRRIVARTLTYLIALVILSTLYGFLVFGIASVIFDIKLPIAVQVVFAASTGVASVCFPGIKSYFDKKTTQFFYQDGYDSDELFNDYNKALVSTIDLIPLLDRSMRVVVERVKCEYAHVVILEEQDTIMQGGVQSTGWTLSKIKNLISVVEKNENNLIAIDATSSNRNSALSKNNLAVVLKIHGQSNALLGYVLIGQKKSGYPYGRQDFKVFEALANELSIALQNALRFEEIERFNETLQRQVEDATRKLKASNLKLKKLNDTKDDFISMTSHQLRTPLTTIKGYVSLVMDEDAGPVNDAQRKLLTQAFGSAQRLVYMVADLLNVSRLKTGKFVIERTPTDLSTIIDDELGQLKAEASLRNLKLEYKMPKKFPILPLDETKTRQVIMNFLDNAIYYTPSGGKIRAELVEKDDSVEFLVIDNGIGVPKEERHHLFSKFYRAKNAQRARPDGTGLGLYMAQKVVVAQGGYIIFNSEEGKGSTFGFHFPKDMPEGQVALPAQAPSGGLDG